MRNTRPASGRGAVVSAGNCGAPGAFFQSPKRASSCGTSAFNVVSPTTTMRAFSGWSQSRWNTTRSSRVSEVMDPVVPLPIELTGEVPGG